MKARNYDEAKANIDSEQEKFGAMAKEDRDAVTEFMANCNKDELAKVIDDITEHAKSDNNRKKIVGMLAMCGWYLVFDDVIKRAWEIRGSPDDEDGGAEA